MTNPLLRIVLPLLLLAAGPLRAAPVFFTDGAAHALPGDPAFVDDDWIILDGGSTLDVAAPARVTGEPATAIDVAFGGDALTSAAGSAVRLAGGQITGGAATGLLDPASPLAGVVAFGGYAIDSGSDVSVEAGTIRGGAAEVLVDPSLDRATALSGAALQIGVATATIEAGVLESGPALAGGGSFENEANTDDVIYVGSDAFLQLRGGVIRAGTARVENDVWPQGAALAIGGAALRARDGSRVLIEGGSLAGGDAFANAGFVTGAARSVPGRALVLEDGGHVVIRGGSFSVGVGGTSAAAGELAEIVPPPALDLDVTGAARPARLILFGGTYRGGSSLRVALTATVPADAAIEIFGGDLDSLGAVDLDLAHPFVTTRIYGSALALDGIPLSTGVIEETSGTLSGTLQMGGDFAWTFERRNGAPLEVYVPEPVGGLAFGLLALGLLRRRSAAGL